MPQDRHRQRLSSADVTSFGTRMRPSRTSWSGRARSNAGTAIGWGVQASVHPSISTTPRASSKGRSRRRITRRYACRGRLLGERFHGDASPQIDLHVGEEVGREETHHCAVAGHQTQLGLRNETGRRRIAPGIHGPDDEGPRAIAAVRRHEQQDEHDEQALETAEHPHVVGRERRQRNLRRIRRIRPRAVRRSRDSSGQACSAACSPARVR